MNDHLYASREDLKFLRSIADESAREYISTSIGCLFASAGVLYGGQAVLLYFQQQTLLSPTGLIALVIGIAPTILFSSILIIIFWRKRGNLLEKGFAARAISGFFGGFGLANVCMVIVFGVAAVRARDWNIWALYPAILAAMMGATWIATSMITKRLWIGAVGIGWFLSAIVIGLAIGTELYMLVIGTVLIALMGAPGIYLVRKQSLSS